MGLFVLEVLLLVLVMALVWASDTGRMVSGQAVRRTIGPLLDSERDRAASLDLGFRPWVGLRLAVCGALLAIAMLSRVPALMAIAVLVGVIGVPWLLQPVIAARRVSAAHDLVAWLRQVASGLRMTSVDEAIRAASVSPPPSIRRVVGPLHHALRMEDALIAAARASRSRLVEDAMVALAAGRTRWVQQMKEQLEQELIPSLEKETELEDSRRETLGQQRSTALTLGGVSAAFVGLFTAVPKLHEFLASGQGQITVTACAVLYCVLVALAGAILRGPEEVRWDLDRVQDMLERLGRA